MLNLQPRGRFHLNKLCRRHLTVRHQQHTIPLQTQGHPHTPAQPCQLRCLLRMTCHGHHPNSGTYLRRKPPHPIRKQQSTTENNRARVAMHGFCFASSSLICPIACAMKEEVGPLVHSIECVWCVLCVVCVIFHLPITRHMTWATIQFEAG